jgi:heterodisulfide reductase subunit B2
MTMTFTYYPGCSLESTGIEFDQSIRAVFEKLDVNLQELEDWSCCGASSAHSVNRELSLALPARNLALAQPLGRDMVIPCAACYNRHKTADYEMRSNPDKRRHLEDLLDFQFKGEIDVRPMLDIVINQIGLEEIKSKVVNPLKGVKAVSYYGCLLVRPPEITRFENPDHPVYMDQILEAIGAEALPWSYATECCGGGLSLTKADVAAKLVSRLVEHAAEAGAEIMVTSCPLCQINLEMRQTSVRNKLPIIYFTEALGLAFGCPEAPAWMRKHLIDPGRYFSSLGLL